MITKNTLNNEIPNGDALYSALGQVSQLAPVATLIDLSQFETASTDYGFMVSGDHIYAQVLAADDPEQVLAEFEITYDSYQQYLESDSAVVEIVGVPAAGDWQ